MPGCSFVANVSLGYDRSDQHDAGALLAWGDYAAALNVPPCPDAATLVVNTTIDEWSGDEALGSEAEAGPMISFTEALWVASNRPGPDTILFDQTVFAAAAPATIVLSTTGKFPLNLGPVCIDARLRGVIVEWPDADPQSLPIFTLGPDSLMVGLTLLRLPRELSIFAGQLAGCRLNTDGHQAFINPRPWVVNLTGDAVFGPGNSVAGATASSSAGGRVLGSARVTGNYFGFDPITRRQLPLERGLTMLTNDRLTVVEDNVFAVTTLAVYDGFNQASRTIELRRNWVGATPEGDVVTPPLNGFLLGTPGTGRTTVGPANVIRVTSVAIEIDMPGPGVTITQNSITGGSSGIVTRNVEPTPPVIIAASASEVSGTCPVPGTIEIFSDPEGQGERYLGSGSCAASLSWQVQVRVPSGQKVTATLTDEAYTTSGFSQPMEPQ